MQEAFKPPLVQKESEMRKCLYAEKEYEIEDEEEEIRLTDAVITSTTVYCSRRPKDSTR